VISAVRNTSPPKSQVCFLYGIGAKIGYEGHWTARKVPDQP
jgi:hypothetical protein